jgi:hypothetical protein
LIPQGESGEAKMGYTPRDKEKWKIASFRDPSKAIKAFPDAHPFSDHL